MLKNFALLEYKNVKKPLIKRAFYTNTRKNYYKLLQNTIKYIILF